MRIPGVVTVMVLLTFLHMAAAQAASGAGSEKGASNDAVAGIYPWCGKYCMSFFTKTRSANTVGKGHLSVSLKAQHFDWDQVRLDGGYQSRPLGQSKQRYQNTLTFKYGWAENHHIAVGIPHWVNDWDIPGSDNHEAGLANVFIFEKWKCIQETNCLPAVAVDLWYYLPTGSTSHKLGSDRGAYKISTEVSKAWKTFSLHFNPNYKWPEAGGAEVGEINTAFLYKLDPDLWPAVEYNYYYKEDSGHRHDIVPGVIWKFKKGWSFKAGLPINLASTFTDRDVVGVVFKLFRRW
jgi:hypothetical protein